MQIAMQLELVALERETTVEGFRVLGPRSRTALLTRYAEKIGRAEEDLSTMKRHWNETLPVLHLAWAFYSQLIKRKADFGVNVVLGSFRSHSWLRPTLHDAEAVAEDLWACGFDPSQRIQLVAEN